ncbi:hypothetical protein GCM10027404_15720 [Arthrobacter tumbae]|uniref:HNH endonuclease signature motif containing protein n=1 Tax=Arthrobacter tumbae TaxID=163874 RepID=UPI00195D552D|nr:HNH endonuclease signature motif containing protein [Arthrobacter tumbae]MBM7780622.1 hypothetical protein [Arthrobacter tumbae]
MSLTAALDALPGGGLRALPSFEFDDPAGSSTPSIGDLLQILAAYASRFVAAFPGMGQEQLAEQATGIEDLSRTVEYLQVVAATAVDRSSAAAGGTPTHTNKTTTDDAGGSPTGSNGGCAPGGVGSASSATDNGAGSAAGGVGFAFGLSGPAGGRSAYRCTAEYLRDRLRISRGEANRRLRLGAKLIPCISLTGEPLPATCEQLAAEVSAGVVSGKAATMINSALDRAQFTTDPAMLDTMEAQLTASATRFDPDFLAKLIHRFEAHLDPDGPEPTDKELTNRQGVFLRGKKRGLHLLDIAATDEQYEYLTTIMNTATNPRTTGTGGDGGQSGSEGSDGGGTGGGGAGPDDAPGLNGHDAPVETRTRAQLLLDGLVGACQIALATDKLPATGGQRPQVLVTIDYQTLLGDIETRTGTFLPAPGTSTGTSNTGASFSPAAGASLAYTGPINARTARQIACDADIIPVVLGGNNEILDLGRAQRLFTAKQRKALIARDKGCAFPACTMPAHWTEAHHIQPWSHEGPTSTDNGVLLCAHHHHLIHQNEWTIHTRDRLPWFIPPPHIDPGQQPRRNHYWTLC